MSDENAIRDANIALATKIMADFNRNMDGWYDNLHDDVVMEFPYGTAVGMPGRVEGKAACSALFATVAAAVQVQFHDVVIHPMLAPHQLIVEYKGYSEPQGNIYDQTYICVQEYRDGKLSLFKEYWNAIIVRDLFSALGGLG